MKRAGSNGPQSQTNIERYSRVRYGPWKKDRNSKAKQPTQNKNKKELRISPDARWQRHTTEHTRFISLPPSGSGTPLMPCRYPPHFATFICGTRSLESWACRVVLMLAELTRYARHCCRPPSSCCTIALYSVRREISNLSLEGEPAIFKLKAGFGDTIANVPWTIFDCDKPIWPV